jgi:hypothetical protein
MKTGRRRLLVLVAAVILLAVRAGSAEPLVNGAEPLRVVTFNLFHGGPASGLMGDG